MAKRFIDTDFFKDPFVRGLQGAYKGLYIYLFLDCSNGGIWNVELDVAKIRCGIDLSISDNEIKEVFKDKIIELENGEKWFLRNFIKVQHNSVLKDNNKAHIGAISELKKYNLLEEIKEGEYQILSEKNKGLKRGLEDPKVKVKVKVKVKEEVKEREKKFKEKVSSFSDKYSEEMLLDFFEYWSERGEGDKKMRFEKQDSFSISRRLGTWLKNSKKFEQHGSKTNNRNSKEGDRTSEAMQEIYAKLAKESGISAH